MIAKIDIILLSILMERPMHGYDIEQAIKERHIRKWAAIGTSSIYSGLDRLQKKGMACSELDASQGLPARRVFSITQLGKETLLEGSKSLLSTGEYIYMDFNVGMTAYPYLNKRELLSLATKRYQEIRAYVKDAQSHWPKQNQFTPEHAVWIWRHEYCLLQAELKWLEEFMTFLQDRYGEEER